MTIAPQHRYIVVIRSDLREELDGDKEREQPKTGAKLHRRSFGRHETHNGEVASFICAREQPQFVAHF